MNSKIPIYTISVPEYHVRTGPNATRISRTIDVLIKKRFLGQRLVVRCLGSTEHRGKTIDDLVQIIKKMGTDRYSQRRKGDRYENLGGKHIDFFALEFKVRPTSQIMEQFIKPFYAYPKKLRGRQIRIDIAILYDRQRVKRVRHTYDGKRIKRDGWVFKESANKPGALKGILKIL